MCFGLAPKRKEKIPGEGESISEFKVPSQKVLCLLSLLTSTLKAALQKVGLERHILSGGLDNMGGGYPCPKPFRALWVRTSILGCIWK